MRGNSPEEVAATLMAQPGLQGLQGPTISPVYGPGELPNFPGIGFCG
jgi:hypothetical protein